MTMLGLINGSNNEETPKEKARRSLQGSIHNRKASLTEVEMAFLSAMLFDPPTDNGSAVVDEDNNIDDNNNCSENPKRINSTASDIFEVERIEKATKVLSNDMLFSVPAGGIDSPKVIPPKGARNPAKLLGLWRAHEDGVAPSKLKRLSQGFKPSDNNELALPRLRKKSETEGDSENPEDDNDDADSVKTDEEVRREKDDKDSDTAHSSWDEEDGGFEHYNAWEVLRDEYATDFGFDYKEPKAGEIEIFDDDSQPKIFRILGTNADDQACMPHVLSPPLMESLLQFVPDGLASDNFWLKYSLVRDGASMKTLKRYVRAAENTILAIETTRGQVFGSFTSSAWSNHYGFYGSGPAFLWRMRHNRRSPCYSLFHQAQMESEIDVFAYSGLNDLLQVCDESKIAIGGGKIVSDDATDFDKFKAADSFNLLHNNNHHVGFGICINSDLISGTSSPCGTFRNPCLSKHSKEAERFEIANIEIWTFTACYDVNSAEQLEMSKFFMSSSSSEESARSGASSSRRDEQSSERSPAHVMNSHDFFQQDFYRRVGQFDENATFRDRWHQDFSYSKHS